MDRRAQSVGFVHFFATLGAGAAVVWVVRRVVGDQLTFMDNNATVGTVQQSNQWFSILVENLPTVFLLLAAVGGIAWAVFQTNYL